VALVLLGALLCLAYGATIFGGRSLVYSNSYNPLDGRFMDKNYGPGFVPPGVWTRRNLSFTANFHDAGGPVWQWEPDAEFARSALRDGEYPLWNPYVGAGTPEMSNLVPAPLFPPYLAMLLLGNTITLRNAYQLGFVLAAGVFTYLFLRREGVGRAPGILGGASFMMCGALAQNVGSFLGQTVACIPFTLLLCRLFVEKPSARRGALLSFGFAAVALASFPPVLLACFGFAALYVVVAAFVGEPAPVRGWRIRLLSRFAGFALLGVGLVSFYYIPALALNRSVPQVANHYAGAAALTVKPACLLQLASPILLGAVEILADPPMPELDNIHIPYAGWIPLLLACFAVWPPRDRTRALWAAGWSATVLVAMKLIGVPPVQWVAYVPLLANIHMAHYLGYLLDLTVALLAALGLQRLLEGRVRVAWCLAPGAVAIVGLLAVRAFAASRGVLGRKWAFQWIEEWRLLLILALLASGCFVLCAWLARRGKPATAPAWALLVLFVAEAVIHTAYPRPKAFDVWRQPPDYVRALMDDPGGRAFTVGVLPANAGGVFAIPQLDSLMAYNAPRVFQLYRAYAASGVATFLTAADRLPPEGVLDSAAIDRIAVTKFDTAMIEEASRRPYTTSFEDALVRIFHRESEPRFYFTSDYRVAPTASEALAALATKRSRRQIVLEESPRVAPTANLDADPEVQVVRMRRNSYRLRLDAPRQGLVYSSDSWMPGWTATVNDKAARVLPANYAFRSVEVPAGPSEIEFTYWPPGLTSGLVLSAASVLAALALALAPRRTTEPEGLTAPAPPDR
jgi:hypothetical protein